MNTSLRILLIGSFATGVCIFLGVSTLTNNDGAGFWFGLAAVNAVFHLGMKIPQK